MDWFDLRPGKEIGLIKTFIRESVLDGKISNTFEAAKELAFKYAADQGIIKEKK
jgi:hypothetical protein